MSQRNAMKHQIEMFRFTLAGGQSIGPAALNAIWASACRTSQVSVSRKPPSNGYGDRPVYTLYATAQLADLPGVERRLRGLLDDAKLAASVLSLHH